MAPFQGKIGGRRLRKRENKIIVSFLSYPARNRKCQKKKAKKLKKLKKYHYGIISSQNSLEKAKKERK